jgi:hypothetical protein
MAAMGKLEPTMTVSFPEIRLRLRQAVDTLCDGELHERLWRRGERASSAELGFNDTILFLVDEMEMFPPTDLVGDVLTDDGELKAFVELTEALNRLLAIIGEHGTYADALKSGAPWQEVTRDACSLGHLLDD